jgi:cytochrome P450
VSGAHFKASVCSHATTGEETVREPVDFGAGEGASVIEEVTRAAARGPLGTEILSGAPVVLRYADVESLARDPRLAGVGLTVFDLMGVTDGPLRDWYGGLMFTNEGDVHHRLRALVARAFTPKAVEAIRSTAAELATTCLEPIATGGEGDLVEANAWLAMRVMCRLLGVPDADVAVFGRWADALSVTFSYMEPHQIAEATSAITDLLEYVRELAEQRRVRPGPDLITALLHAETEDDRLTRDELVSMVTNLLVGGHDTTTSQIGCSLLALLSEPEQTDHVRTRRDLVPSAIAETIRLQPSIPAMPRTVVAPIAVAGEEIPAGSMVFLCTAAANREPSVWKNADRFEASRFADPSTPRLLTFGAGPHYCLGAALARLTIEECVGAMLDLPRPARLVEDPARIPWRTVLGRSPTRLLVTMR